MRRAEEGDGVDISVNKGCVSVCVDGKTEKAGEGEIFF
jgi:hypothetical protein